MQAEGASTGPVQDPDPDLEIGKRIKTAASHIALVTELGQVKLAVSDTIIYVDTYEDKENPEFCEVWVSFSSQDDPDREIDLTPQRVSQAFLAAQDSEADAPAQVTPCILKFQGIELGKRFTVEVLLPGEEREVDGIEDDSLFFGPAKAIRQLAGGCFPTDSLLDEDQQPEADDTPFEERDMTTPGALQPRQGLMRQLRKAAGGSTIIGHPINQTFDFAGVRVFIEIVGERESTFDIAVSFALLDDCDGQIELDTDLKLNTEHSKRINLAGGWLSEGTLVMLEPHANSLGQVEPQEERILFSKVPRGGIYKLRV